MRVPFRRTGRSGRIGLAALTLSAWLQACVVDNTGPDPFDDRFDVEGIWDIDAFVRSSTCGFVRDEPFVARVFQNREILQIVVEVSGFGEVRYDGFLERDGDFEVSHTTVFPDQAIRDDSEVEGSFRVSGRSLFATETEIVTDLLTGRRCSIVWEWRGSR